MSEDQLRRLYIEKLINMVGEMCSRCLGPMVSDSLLDRIDRLLDVYNGESEPEAGIYPVVALTGVAQAEIDAGDIVTVECRSDETLVYPAKPARLRTVSSDAETLDIAGSPSGTGTIRKLEYDGMADKVDDREPWVSDRVAPPTKSQPAPEEGFWTDQPRGIADVEDNDATGTYSSYGGPESVPLWQVALDALIKLGGAWEEVRVTKVRDFTHKQGLRQPYPSRLYSAIHAKGGGTFNRATRDQWSVVTIGDEAMDAWIDGIRDQFAIACDGPHVWKLEGQVGPKVRGVCQRCGEIKGDFANSLSYTDWSQRTVGKT